MIRGTTPKLEFTIPFGTDLIKEVYVTFAQGANVILEKQLADCVCEGERLVLKLSQADTLAFMHGQLVDVQLRVKTVNGEALASDIIRTTAERILKDGEI